VRWALAENFDLVVTDLKMPDLDGMDLVRTLRSKRPRTAVVVITGYGTVRSALEAARAGVSDYLEKPFTPAQLTEAAGRALQATQEEGGARIDAKAVRDVLRLASRDHQFGASLLAQGSRILSGYPLGPEAKAAIVSGDIAWIEKKCGELSGDEREWLDHRLESEIW